MFTLNGFRVTSGTEDAAYFNAYIAENRAYYGFDDVLRTGPYNFGFLDNPALGNWVERFSYEDGLLISYWDTSQSDNSTSAHPGEGLILPIDAHPATMRRADGGIWRSRIQSYDSTFGLEPTAESDAALVEPAIVPSEPAGGAGLRRHHSVLQPGHTDGRRDEPQHGHPDPCGAGRPQWGCLHAGSGTTVE